MNPHSTLQARISDRTLHKVSRLFNASHSDILHELLQNARRAQATEIQLHCNGEWLSISDNGQGIGEPQTLLTLGDSQWNETTQRREDPAGMGIFSLANRTVKIRSGDWQVSLTPDHFTGEQPAQLEPQPRIEGTRIDIQLQPSELKTWQQDAEAASQYYPIPVRINEQPTPQRSFLESALLIREWQGLEIGVFTDGSSAHRTINFYGLIIDQTLPTLRCKHTEYRIRINVQDCPDLQLVLPARKEVVQNEFWRTLLQQSRITLYQYIATLAHHDLPYVEWQKAQQLGIDLPPAHAELEPYQPAIANVWDIEHPQNQPVPDNALLINAEMGDIGQTQSFWRAFQSQTEYSPYQPEADYAGYPWYDNIPVLTLERYEIIRAGQAIASESISESAQPMVVEQITAIATLRYPDGQQCQKRYSTDLLLLRDPDHWYYGVEDVQIVVTPDHQISVDELAEILKASYFNPSDDVEADSYETQRENFAEESMALAIRTLMTDEEALRTQIQMVAERHLRWLIPHNHQMVIQLLPQRPEDNRIRVEL